MDIVGERIKSLREGAGLSQAKVANMLNTQQSAIFRYENNVSEMPYAMLVQYADYFDVSLDYLFGRTDYPQGKLYEYHTQTQTDNPELKQFIEMCFDPSSAMHAKFKDALLSLLSGGKEG